MEQFLLIFGNDRLIRTQFCKNIEDGHLSRGVLSSLIKENIFSLCEDQLLGVCQTDKVRDRKRQQRKKYSERERERENNNSKPQLVQLL